MESLVSTREDPRAVIQDTVLGTPRRECLHGPQWERGPSGLCRILVQAYHCHTKLIARIFLFAYFWPLGCLPAFLELSLLGKGIGLIQAYKILFLCIYDERYYDKK